MVAFTLQKAALLLLFLKFGFWIRVVLHVFFFKLNMSLSCDSENGGAECPVCPLLANVFQDGAWIWSVYPSSRERKCKIASQKKYLELMVVVNIHKKGQVCERATQILIMHNQKTLRTGPLNSLDSWMQTQLKTPWAPGTSLLSAPYFSSIMYVAWVYIFSMMS